MEWTDEAIVLGVRKHGETSVIAELMTLERGRHMGLVQGGRSRTMRPILQPGNSVRATWRARLDEHLGQFKLEPEQLRAAHLMQSAHAVFALQTITTHIRLLPERDAHGALYDMLIVVLDNLDNPAIAGEVLIRFELAILHELGFGLDLSACASTGSRANLLYVSPKSGRAVSATAGEPWADRMLQLPQFLRHSESPRSGSAAWDELQAGFELTHFFMDRNVYGPRNIEPPTQRGSFIAALEREIG